MRIVIICVLVGLLGGCREVPQGVEDALVLSGSNKGVPTWRNISAIARDAFLK